MLNNSMAQKELFIDSNQHILGKIMVKVRKGKHMVYFDRYPDYVAIGNTALESFENLEMLLKKAKKKE